MYLYSYAPLAQFQLRYLQTSRDQCAFDVGKEALLLKLLRNNTDNGYIWMTIHMCEMVLRMILETVILLLV